MRLILYIALRGKNPGNTRKRPSWFDCLPVWHYGEPWFFAPMPLVMHFPFSGRMRQHAARYSLPFMLLALTLSGCSFGAWFSRGPSPDPAPAAKPEEPAEAPAKSSWLPSFSRGKETQESNPQYVTEEDLLKVVAEFQRASRKDTYRFPTPKDVTGANVNKATLTRLQDYEMKHPGAYPELIAFTRARAYEGLHEYDKAITQYQIVAQSRHQLKDESAKAVEILTRYQAVRQRDISADTPLDYLKSLDEQIAAWQELAKQTAGTPYESLAREEEERLDRAKVTFLEINRYRLEDGNESVVLAYRQLLDKHKESKNSYRYQLEFADFYSALAQEYVAQTDPQSLQFDSSVFEDLGRMALRLYAQVAQEDGVMEKLEAKGKLEALEAYMAKVGRLAR